MMKSMTGFGKTTFMKEGKSITIEIRTLNSKQLDVNLRLSSQFREKENDIRNIIVRTLQRGKIDVAVYIEKNETLPVNVNTDLAKKYYTIFSSISADIGSPISSELFIQALKMPEVISSDKEEFNDDFWIELFSQIEKTTMKVNEFRSSEGEELGKDFIQRIHAIRLMIDEIAPYEKQRVTTLREKFDTTLSKILPDGKYDKNRLEEEIIYYIEKLDITEEKVRLAKHCEYFLKTMHEEKENGKKLGFIAQEIGREVNTIGSKANDFQIQQIVVRMKDEIEKIKEQLANIL